jgi:hypothetical protein
MWKVKGTGRIYDTDQVMKLVNNPLDAPAAIMKLKWLIGARRYMKNPFIANTMEEQVGRIGTILGALDEEMPNHPRTVSKRPQTPWKRQGLKKLWEDYMDERFTQAKARTTFSMDQIVKALEAKYVNGKKQTPQTEDLIRKIKTISTEWKKEKRSQWNSPFAKVIGTK